MYICLLFKPPTHDLGPQWQHKMFFFFFLCLYFSCKGIKFVMTVNFHVRCLMSLIVKHSYDVQNNCTISKHFKYIQSHVNRRAEVFIKADPSLYSDLQNHIFMFIKCSISQYHLHLTWTEKNICYCFFSSCVLVIVLLFMCLTFTFKLLTFSLQFHLYWIVVTHF